MMLAITLGASPALVRLVQREMELGAYADAPDDRDDAEQNRRCDRWREALAAVADFRAQSAADVALKLRTAVRWDGDIRETAEDGCNSAMAIVVALADLDRLAAAKVMEPA